MNMLVNIIDYLLSILRLIIIVHFVMSILVSFNVINTYNDFVRGLLEALDRLTAPIYRPIRRFMPDLGQIDFTPMVVLILLAIVQNFILPELRF
jgi:YggT family protein